MSDAKELLAEIDGLATTMFDSAETQIDTQAELLVRARAWIERWAPVVEALQGYAQARGHLSAAWDDLSDAVAAVLKEDKP